MPTLSASHARSFRPGHLALLLALAYIASQATIGYIIQPLGVEQFLRFQLSTDKAQALAVLDDWGAEGRARFMKHFRLDFIHPLIYGALLYTLLRLSWVSGTPRGPVRALLALPLLSAACDLGENLLEIWTVRAMDQVPAAVVACSGALATLKWLLAGLCLVLVLAGGLRLAWRRWRRP